MQAIKIFIFSLLIFPSFSYALVTYTYNPEAQLTEIGFVQVTLEQSDMDTACAEAVGWTVNMVSSPYGESIWTEYPFSAITIVPTTTLSHTFEFSWSNSEPHFSSPLLAFLPDEVNILCSPDGTGEALEVSGFGDFNSINTFGLANIQQQSTSTATSTVVFDEEQWTQLISAISATSTIVTPNDQLNNFAILFSLFIFFIVFPVAIFFPLIRRKNSK